MNDVTKGPARAGRRLRGMVAATALACVCGLAVATLAAHAGGSMKESKPAAPIACRLDAFDAEERAQHDALTKALRDDIQQTQDLPNGYAFRLPASSKCFAETAAWIALERRCCPFFDFELTWRGQDPAPWLRLTGGKGVKEFVRQGLVERS